MTTDPMITIAKTLGSFLATEKERTPEGAKQTEFLLDNLVTFLEAYGHQYVPDEPDDAERDFIDGYGPDIILESMSEFLYYWNIRKYMGDEDDVRATALLMERLMEWLADEGLADRGKAAEAATLARTASEELPRALRLSGLFYDLAQAAGPGSATEPDDIVDDVYLITRVEPGFVYP